MAVRFNVVNIYQGLPFSYQLLLYHVVLYVYIYMHVNSLLFVALISIFVVL